MLRNSESHDKLLKSLERVVEKFSHFSKPRVAISRGTGVAQLELHKKNKSLRAYVNLQRCPPSFIPPPFMFATCWDSLHCKVKKKSMAERLSWNFYTGWLWSLQTQVLGDCILATRHSILKRAQDSEFDSLTHPCGSLVIKTRFEW